MISFTWKSSENFYANRIVYNRAWEQRKLGEVTLSLEYGLNVASKEYDGNNKYLRITDIDEETRNFSDDDLTTPDVNLNESERYRLQINDILFARTGASVGKTYNYRSTDGVVYYAGFLIRARINKECDSEFIFQNTWSNGYQNYIRITSQRSGQPGVNAEEYAQYVFLMPAIEEQRKTGAFFYHLDHLITLHQRESTTRKQSFNSVLITTS